MPKYQVICLPRVIKDFDIISKAEVSCSAHSQMNLITWESSELDPHILSLVRQHNQDRITSVLHQVTELKAVFFDMDATVIQQETINEIARVAGSSHEVEAITEKAMTGAIDFQKALEMRVATLKGLPVVELERVHERLTLNPGLEDFSRVAVSKGIKLFLISGGFERFAARIAHRLGFSGYRANQLEIRDGSLTGGLVGSIIDSAKKKSFLLETCKNLGISTKECMAVGDGANDLPMLEEAGISIGFSPKPILIPHVNGALYENHLPLIDIIDF